MLKATYKEDENTARQNKPEWEEFWVNRLILAQINTDWWDSV